MCARWEKLDVAFNYILDHIVEKEDADNRYGLSLQDLLLVTNFKAGNSVIAEPAFSLAHKLEHFSRALQEFDDRFGLAPLQTLNEGDLNDLIILCDCLMDLNADREIQIAGFGYSFTSALAAAHFPDLVPVLDRNVLRGANESGAAIDFRIRGTQVLDLQSHYGSLIRFCHATLIDPPDDLQTQAPINSLRNLDKALFCRGRARN
jgi:hypothetical protein